LTLFPYTTLFRSYLTASPSSLTRNLFLFLGLPAFYEAPKPHSLQLLGSSTFFLRPIARTFFLLLRKYSCLVGSLSAFTCATSASIRNAFGEFTTLANSWQEAPAAMQISGIITNMCLIAFTFFRCQ